MLKIFLKSPIYYHVIIYNKLNQFVKKDFYNVYYWSKVGITPYNDKEMPNLKRVWISEHDLLHNHTFIPSLKIGPWDGGFIPRLSIKSWFEILRSKNDDVLFLQGYSNLDEIICLMLSKFVKSKVMFRGEGDPKASENKIKVLFKKFLLSHVDVAFYSTQSNKKYYLDYIPKHTYLIYYPSVSVMDSTPLDYTIRENTVVVASRLTDRKRVDIALLIFSKCFPENFELKILGDGDEKIIKELKLLTVKLGISHRVQFLGFLSQKGVSEHFCSAKFYLNTSSYDPSPKALNEALEAECRVIISKSVGTSSTVESLDGVKVTDLEEINFDDIKLFVDNELIKDRNPIRVLPSIDDCIKGLLNGYKKVI